MASATTSATALPSGYRPPLAVVTPYDHSAWPIICNAFGLTVILLCLAIRVYIRTKISPPFGNDDHLLTAATVFAIIQSAIVFDQVHEGFGKTIDDIPSSNLVQIQKLAYVSQLFYIIVLYLAKCSIVMLFRRISPDLQHKRAAWVVLGACILMGVTSFFLVALRCDLSAPWLTYGRTCPSYVGQWSAVAAFDIVTELALFAMSIQLVWKLQTSFARKSRVVFAFALRLPLIAIAAVRLSYVINQVHSDNPTLAGAITSVVQQLEVFYSIMATTIPCLRPFLAGFVTHFGAMGGETVMGGSQIGGTAHKGDKNASKYGKGSFAMSSLTSSGEGETGQKKKRFMTSSALRSKDRTTRSGHNMSGGASGVPNGGDSFNPDQTTHHASISHGARRKEIGPDGSSIASNESQRMIIRREIEWHVESDGNSRDNSRLAYRDV